MACCLGLACENFYLPYGAILKFSLQYYDMITFINKECHEKYVFVATDTPTTQWKYC